MVFVCGDFGSRRPVFPALVLDPKLLHELFIELILFFSQ